RAARRLDPFDRGHDSLRGARVAIPPVIGTVVFPGFHGPAVSNRDWRSEMQPAVPAEGVERPKYAGRNDGHSRAAGDQPDPGPRRLKLSVPRPRSLGEKDDDPSQPQGLEHPLDCCDVRSAVPVDGNRADAVEPPRCEAPLPKRLARKENDLLGNIQSDHRRIEEAGMVGSDDVAAPGGKVLEPGNLPPKKDFIDDPDDRMAEAI